MIRQATINGELFEYDDEKATFIVQSVKGDHKFKDRYSFKGDLGQAIKYYRCINIGNGYKKRIIVVYPPSCETCKSSVWCKDQGEVCQRYIMKRQRRLL